MAARAGNEPEVVSAFPARRAPQRPDVIAPGSSVYVMLSDATLLMYPLPAFMLPLLHPATADSTAQFDVAVAEGAHVGLLIKRVIDTFEMVGAVVFGGPESADVSYAVRELHRDLGGVIDTTAYHPWSRELWTWNWAAITAAVMGVYGSIRRWPSNQFRDEAYLGMVEIGRRFGVLGMPETYAEFSVVWPVERDREAVTDSAALVRVAGIITATGMTAPDPLRALPAPVWAAVTWPLRHMYRVSISAAVTPEHRRALGLPTGRRDDAILRVHRIFWRLIPRQLTHRMGVAYFWARLRWGTPVWRDRYSREALAQRRHR